MSRHPTREISMFKPVSVAEQANFNITVRNLEDRLCCDAAHLKQLWHNVAQGSSLEKSLEKKSP